MTAIRLAELIEDMNIYPRHRVDTGHVSDIARAITAGHLPPPPVIDEVSKRITDGVHRCRAWRKVLGPGGTIEVELRTYPDEVALLVDAIRLNSAHARKLDAHDRTRCAILLEDRGVPEAKIAVTLHTTEPRVRELLTRVVVVQPKKGAAERHPAKPVTYPVNGQPRVLSPEQMEVARSSGGLRVQQTAAQLTREITAGVVDVTDYGVREKLWLLHDTIAAVVPQP